MNFAPVATAFLPNDYLCTPRRQTLAETAAAARSTGAQSTAAHALRGLQCPVKIAALYATASRGGAPKRHLDKLDHRDEPGYLI